MKSLNYFLASLILISLPFITHAQVYSTGALFDINDYQKSELANFRSMGFNENVPNYYSLKIYAPIPKNQGMYGTCTGWSSTYGALTIQFAKKFGIMDKNKNTALAFCPYFTYNQIKHTDDNSCQRGSQIYNALANFRIYGAKRYYLPEYDCGIPVDEDALANAKPYKIKSFKRLFDYPSDLNYDDWLNSFFATSIDKATPTREAVGNGYAVVIGAYLTQSFFGIVGTDLYEPTYDEKMNYPNSVKDANGNNIGHAMCVIGYDDNKYGGAFEVMNSWGTEWGDQGFFWIKYEDFNRLVFSSFYFELFDDFIGSSGCVYGDCEDGYGMMKYGNGDIYEGQFEDAKKNGYGIYVWSDGAAYAGQWQMDLRCGYAVELNPGYAPVKGYWEADVPVDYTVSCGNTVETGCIDGDCQDGIGTYKYGNGTYNGTFKNGYRHGYGRYIFDGGSIYECTWDMGKQSGFGRVTVLEGNKYIVEFKDGKMDGMGLLYYNSGYKYGKWSDGEYVKDEDWLGTSGPRLAGSSDKPNEINFETGTVDNCVSGDCDNGFGTQNYDNGTYTGYFKDGKRSGYGVYVWNDGLKYEGNWENDKQEGLGKYLFTNGSYYFGEMRRGLQDGYGIEVAFGVMYPGIWELGAFKPDQYRLGFSENDGDLVIGPEDLMIPEHNSELQKLRIRMAAKTAVGK